MPEVRLLVQAADKDGKEHPAGEVVDVDDETAASWRAAGKASLVADEKAAEEAAAQGHYSDATGREDVGALGGGGATPGPQAEEDEDETKSRRGKK
jgi:hypothetical protein